MNGVSVRGTAEGDELERQMDALSRHMASQHELFEWYDREFRRLVATAGWADDADVPLRVWRQRFPGSIEASLDAFSAAVGTDVRRLLGAALDVLILSPPEARIGGEEVSE